jgi:hypothetical protein
MNALAPFALPGGLTLIISGTIIVGRQKITSPRPAFAEPAVPGDLGTKGGLRTDERALVLRDDGTPIAGLYGQHERGRDGPQLRRRGRDDRPRDDLRPPSRPST